MGTDADKHRYFEGMAVAHVLGGLDESDGQVFRSHLLECSDCRAHVGELRALAHELADVERDERRVRAAKSVETKRRQATDDDEEEGAAAIPPSPAARVPRLLVLLGVLVLVGLAAWNLTLRSTVANQQAHVDTMADGAELLEFGDEVDWVSSLEDIDATVKMRDGRLVLLIVGLDDDATHAIYQLDASDGVVAAQTAEVTEGRIHYLVPLREDTRQLVVTRTGASVPDQPTGERLLEATLP